MRLNFNYYLDFTALENMPDFFFRWCMATNHKEISMLYAFFSLICGSITFFISFYNITYPFIYTVIPGPTILLLFFLILPFFYSCISIAFLPILCGSEELAFPRLTSLSFWLLFVAFLVFCTALLLEHSIDTLYFRPLSSSFTPSNLALDFVIFSFLLLLLSLYCLSINFITTIINMRSPGLYLSRLPFFVWLIFIISLILFILLPVFASFLILLLSNTELYALFLDITINLAIYFVLFILFLFLLGTLPYLIKSFVPFIYQIALFLFVLITIIALSLWFYSFFTLSLTFNTFQQFFFNIAIIPIIALFFNCLTKSCTYLLNLRTSSLFLLALFIYLFISLFLFFFCITSPLIYDFYFIFINFQYCLILCLFFGFFANFYLWFTKITGCYYSQFLSKLHFLLLFIGSIFIFLPFFFLGFVKMPWYFPFLDYQEAYASWNSLLSLGFYIFFISFFIFIFLIHKAISTKNIALYEPEHASISRVPYFCSVNFHGTSTELLVENFPFDEEAIFFSAVISYFFKNVDSSLNIYQLDFVFKKFYFLPIHNTDYKFFYLYTKVQTDALFLLDSEYGLVKEMPILSRWSGHHNAWITAYRMPESREWRWFVDIYALSILEMNQFWSKYFWYK